MQFFTSRCVHVIACAPTLCIDGEKMGRSESVFYLRVACLPFAWGAAALMVGPAWLT